MKTFIIRDVNYGGRKATIKANTADEALNIYAGGCNSFKKLHSAISKDEYNAIKLKERQALRDKINKWNKENL